jgi:hypothetical protein
VHSTDRDEFDSQLAILCAGYDRPVGDRSEAYWKGCAKMSLIEFARIVDYALGEQGPEKIPTVNQLWRLRSQLRTPNTLAVAQIDTSEATVQEQLCAYATLHSHDRSGPKGMTLLEFSRPWTYVYREWIDPAMAKKETNPLGRCAECIGLVIELDNGKRIGWSLAAMLADQEGHAKALRSFRPGPRPTLQQQQAYSKLPDLRS